jgi:hypothetical protein|tara:strand:+ start:5696 stop:5875 length:180 start_codon:yes stop_codon:yes gene_type:complete
METIKIYFDNKETKEFENNSLKKEEIGKAMANGIVGSDDDSNIIINWGKVYMVKITKNE